MWAHSTGEGDGVRHTTNAEQHRHMREMQALNKARYVPAEEWAWKRIRKTGGKWERQAIWSCRIFDFFSIKRGIAVEIDGDTHNPTYDAIRDEYNFFRSGIVVLRVRNFNEADLDAAIAEIERGETRKERRKRVRRELGLPENAPMRAAVEAAGLKLAHGKWRPPGVS